MQYNKPNVNNDVRSEEHRLTLSISSKVFNPAYLPFLYNQKRYLHLWGGAGSGKSVFAAQKVVYRMLTEKGHTMLLICKVARNIRQSCFAEVCKVIRKWNLEPLFTIRSSVLEIECNINGNLILCRGLDDPEKLKSITGRRENITSVWIEEATGLTFDDFLEVDRRLRGHSINYKQIILSYNPIDCLHWINTEIHQKGLYADRTALCHTTYKDNLFLPEEDRHTLEAQVSASEIHHSIYALGLWTVPKDVIFKWAPSEYFPNGGEECYGLDFGINVPTALVNVRFPDSSSVYWREVLYRANVTNSDLIEFLKEEIPESRRHIPIYADPAEKNRIIEIGRAGFNIIPAQKNVTDGIDYVNRFELFITDDSVNLKEEIGIYKYRTDKNGKPTDEPIKIFDHACDAGRYATYTHGMKYIRLGDGNSNPLPRSSNKAGRSRAGSARSILKNF